MKWGKGGFLATVTLRDRWSVIFWTWKRSRIMSETRLTKNETTCEVEVTMSKINVTDRKCNRSLLTRKYWVMSEMFFAVQWNRRSFVEISITADQLQGAQNRTEGFSRIQFLQNIILEQCWMRQNERNANKIWIKKRRDECNETLVCSFFSLVPLSSSHLFRFLAPTHFTLEWFLLTFAILEEGKLY